MFDEVLSALEDLFDRDDFARLFVLCLEDFAIRTLTKTLLENEVALNFFVRGRRRGLHGGKVGGLSRCHWK